MTITLPPDPVEAFAVSDPEIDALAACLKALLPLPSDAQSRIIEYLDDRLKPRPLELRDGH